MPEIIFYLIIFILVADFGLQRYLSYLNIRHSKKELPAVLADIYPKEKYKRQQEYLRTNSRFGMISGSFSFLITLAIYAAGGFGWLDQLVQTFTDYELLQSLIFFCILFVASDLIGIPFEWYDTFVIEQKFEFNKITPRIFIFDKLKGYFLSVVLGGGLLSLIIWIYSLTPAYFWLLGWAVVTFFSIFMGFFYSELIVPLFNKQTPLEVGELRSTIEKFASKAGFQLKNIYVIDGSKRSTKANAYFTGFGSKKRIVLYDTLMDKMTTDEIVSVLAHEVGHYKHKHTIKNMWQSAATTLLLFYLLGVFLKSDSLAQALGGEKANFHLNMLAFTILYSPFSLLIGLAANQLSRKYEYQADAYAARNGLGEELISGLKKLSSSSLSNLMPHPVYVFFNYSHPTLYQRIKNIKAL